jgi:hypothetical protein
MREQKTNFPVSTKRRQLPPPNPPSNPNRAGHYAGFHPEDQPFISTELEEDESYYMTRKPTSAVRYQTIEGHQVLRQGNKQYIIHAQPPPIRRRSLEPEYIEVSKRQIHWLVWVGIAMFVMVAGWIAINALGAFWQVKQDDWHFGMPRTYQVNAVVGHNDSASNPSHFIAINLNRHVEVIEIPGGDASHAVIYTDPTLLGDGQDLTPVTLSFSDVNGDGKTDMLVHILDQTLIFLNNGTKFVAPK